MGSVCCLIWKLKLSELRKIKNPKGEFNTTTMEPKSLSFKYRSAEKSDFDAIKELLFAGLLEKKDEIPKIIDDYLNWCVKNDMKDCESFWSTYFPDNKNKSGMLFRLRSDDLGNFWVVEDNDSGKIVATVGLESKSDEEAELRRMCKLTKRFQYSHECKPLRRIFVDMD